MITLINLIVCIAYDDHLPVQLTAIPPSNASLTYRLHNYQDESLQKGNLLSKIILCVFKHLKNIKIHPSQVSLLTGGNEHPGCKLFHLLPQLCCCFFKFWLYMLVCLEPLLAVFRFDSWEKIIHCLLKFARYLLCWLYFVHFHWLVRPILKSLLLHLLTLTIYLMIQISVFLTITFSLCQCVTSL